MKGLQVGICGIALAALVGCSAMGTGDKRIDYRSEAASVPPLEVPPDLTMPAGSDRYRVPEGEGESVATYSDYTKGSGKGGAVGGGVLPTVKGVHLERSGAQRWLVVENTPENVWPVVKAFFTDLGLTIKSEDQAAGVMETEWAENRAKIPEGGLRSIIGKVFDNLYSTNTRDQFRVRLERSKDGRSTEVYLTHRGTEEMLSADGSSSKWQPRPADPELEAEMLQRLMVRFGSTEAQAAAEVKGAAAGAGAARLEQVSGGSIIVLNEPFDKSWRRVGLAIDRARLAVEDKDRARGIFFLRPVKAEGGLLEKLKFWKDSADTNKRYRVNIKDAGSACEVSVTDENGQGNDMSKQIVEEIYKNISQ
ncbi:MAG TPA: outer membrane protein assembly factor BamC [Gallionella sp.]|nr:outer membrane protein assembly factor BamC [Gallionella sp.]